MNSRDAAFVGSNLVCHNAFYPYAGREPPLRQATRLHQFIERGSLVAGSGAFERLAAIHQAGVPSFTLRRFTFGETLQPKDIGAVTSWSTPYSS